MAVLLAAGACQSLGTISIIGLLLQAVEERFRARVMGLRMLAVYGLPLGLLLSGPMIEHVGFAVTGSLFSLVGLTFTVLIAAHWRDHLWHPQAAANR
jgi:hypothetical protein